MSRHAFSFIVTLTMGATLGLIARAPAAANVEDDFNRANSQTVGDTSDGNGTWNESEGEGGPERVEIRRNAARIAYNKAYANPGMSLADLKLADGVVEADINIVSSASLNRLHGINYRANTNFKARYVASDNTFHALVKSQWDTDEDVELRFGETVLATGDIEDAEKDRPFTLRVEFNGSNHRVYVGDNLVIDYTDPENRNDAGAVGLGVYLGAMDVDRFKVTDVPEAIDLPEPGA